MFSGVYSAASALRTAELQQDVIATNLAHLNVPGFRRSNLTVAAFAEQLAAEDPNSPGYGATVESIAIDFTEGPNVNTGRGLDVAIVGDAFFVVQGQEGPLYTRNGVFRLDENQTLVGASGFPVLSDGGPITIPNDVSSSQIHIANDGTITANDTQLGKLQLVQFDDNTQLAQVGTTLFSSAEPATPAEPEVQVVQGMREQSNVSPVDELVSMIVAARYHEAAQRTLKLIDDTIQQQTDPQG